MSLSLLLFLFFALHTFFVASAFVLHYFDTATRARPVAPWSSYLRAARREWWYELVSLLAFPLGWVRPLGPRRFDAGGGPPIVLVHGYARNRGCMLAIVWRLRRAGYRNLYNLGLGDTRDPLEVIGARLLAQLKALAEVIGERRVIGIGHSMGGLVLRYALQHGAPIERLITLGTPHRGTRMAYLGPGESAVEMRPEAPFLASLDDPPAVPLTAFYSNLDNIVVPFESAAYGDDTALFEARGHMTLAYDAELFEALRGKLDVQVANRPPAP